jgi:hypothetical protein
MKLKTYIGWIREQSAARSKADIRASEVQTMTTQKSSNQLSKALDRSPQPGAVPLFPQRLLDGREVASQEEVSTEAKSAGASKGKKAKRKKELGSSRAIETMFRTAYRAQLDLTALAATKANIMISLNGLILSVLTLSGPFVLVAEPLFTAPIAVFLGTCLTSIMFAVLAAQPRFVKSKSTIEQFKKDESNILVFEQFSSLDIDEHTKVMTGLLRNNQRIYKNMSRQLYLLGIDAHRKFRLLKLSYTSFLVGLTVSTLMLMAVGFLYHTHDLQEIMASLQSRFMPLQPSQ